MPNHDACHWPEFPAIGQRHTEHLDLALRHGPEGLIEESIWDHLEELSKLHWFLLTHHPAHLAAPAIRMPLYWSQGGCALLSSPVMFQE